METEIEVCARAPLLQYITYFTTKNVSELNYPQTLVTLWASRGATSVHTRVDMYSATQSKNR